MNGVDPDSGPGPEHKTDKAQPPISILQKISLLGMAAFYGSWVFMALVLLYGVFEIWPFYEGGATGLGIGLALSAACAAVFSARAALKIWYGYKGRLAMPPVLDLPALLAMGISLYLALDFFP